MATKTNTPCAFCEFFMIDTVCENKACPVYKMLAENDRLKKKVARLERKIERMKEEQESNAAWEKDFRCGQVQGMW